MLTEMGFGQQRWSQSQWPQDHHNEAVTQSQGKSFPPVRRRGASQERSSLGCPEGDAGPKSKKGRGSQAAHMIVPL
jgi:hypothetical protein